MTPPATAAPMQPVAVVAQSLACAAGVGVAALADALRHNRSALQPNTFTTVALDTWVGEVPQLMRDGALPPHLAQAPERWDCRATRLAWLGLQADGFDRAVAQACQRLGRARVGLVLGTSASTIGASEQAYRTLDEQGGFPPALRSETLNTIHAVTAFVQAALDICGPCATVSTACSSSAKAFAQAARWLHLGLVDAVVVGGVDALCNSVLFGFSALQLVSSQPCRPFDAQRQGISVGEAAGFVLLQRSGESADAGAVQLVGYGESNDAHHMSSPHPQGLGAERALLSALTSAGLAARDIGHVSLHGTATALNDSVEAALVARHYSGQVHASATKGCTGHTMGAAGIVGALVGGLALTEGLQSGSPGTQQVDAQLPWPFAQQLRLLATASGGPSGRSAPGGPVRHAAVHAFGFGGNNCVLVFGATP